MGSDNALEPLEINGIILSNRIVFPAFQTNFSTQDGFVTERLYRMYENIGKGGSALIIAGCIAVSDDGIPNTNVLRISKDEHTASLKKLFEIIKNNGAVPGAQLIHAGRQTRSSMTGYPLVAPSPIPCPVMKETPVELDKSGIKRVQGDFADAAGRVKKAGAELIELHGAFGYLIGGFLSPYSDKRKDEYGMDRSLFFTEIIKKVKKKVGNIPVSCRISADEYIEGGLTLNETREIALKLVEAGTDLISVAAGTYASMSHMAPTMSMGEGVHTHLAKVIHDAVDVPVICAGNIRNLEHAGRIISEKKADLVAICRPQVADPFFINKSIIKQPVEQCDDCGCCLFWLRGTDSVYCPKNPGL